MLKIFEHPSGLLIAAAVTFFILLIFRAIFPDKRRWWQWLLPLLLAVAALALDFLVQTDAEKIKALIYTAAKAVEEENPDAIKAIVAENYRDSYHNSKVALMRHCRTRLSEPLVEKGIARIVSTQIQPPQATAVFTIRILFDKQSYVYQSFKREIFTKVKLDLQKHPRSQWLINRAEILEIDRQPSNWKNLSQTSW